jgi:formylglycine-generating enzyme required for sulfatase activity
MLALTAFLLPLINAQTVAQTSAADDPFRLPAMFEVIAVEPDPAVVNDEDARNRIRAAQIPWHVRHRQSGIDLYLVPAGTFMRGTDDEERQLDTGFPYPWRREVEIVAPFYLGVTEVTEDQWARVCNPLEPPPDLPENYPKGDVEMADIQRFMALSGLQLPRDSEWEYACKAGLDVDRYGPIDEIAWYQDNTDWSQRGVIPRKPVGQKRPNRWGFHDMIGNLSELTASMNAKTKWPGVPTDRIYLSSHDDLARSIRYVRRGGGLGNPPFTVHASTWCGYLHDQHHPTVGFRVAWHLPGNEPPVIEDEEAAAATWVAPEF